MKQLDKTANTYTPLFCEENIWKLINTLYTNQIAKPIDVLFILNQTSSVALFGQNKADTYKPVIWDYHVILTAELSGNIVVFDFDSRCGFPVRLIDYFNETFPQTIKLNESFQPLIKSIKPNYYLKHFYSDRSHMKNVIDDTEFPGYKIIEPDDDEEKLTLNKCRNLEDNIPNCKIELPEKYLERLIKTKTQTPE
ncbi:MAG: hypothetical protein DIZ80_07130 [endosymbiont of Galathealinum brachiosum]|uniref:Protein N-terminal glutamine amidohydrolase n=1 Tax=endosymbiont of Galathealinum brachiosum TaxID=2200906 RepID=A0A370DG75_9GAMM|nr:MAG: hypothetical protein DIZ80_07130 [endosymbiont of Galathealinum brachiosum]